MHYVLTYELASDYLERRPQFRAAHLQKAWDSSSRGELLAGGVLTDPIDRALIVFQGESPEVARRFAETDPYVLNGLVRRWEVRPWTTVAGPLAATPVRPEDVR